MGRSFTWGNRCPGKGGGSLRECPHLRVEIWGMRICCLAPMYGLADEQAAGFYVVADEGDSGFERRSRSEDGRDAVFF